MAIRHLTDAVLAVLVVNAVACEPGQKGPGPGTDIPVVASKGAVWDTAAAWRVEPEPYLVIGVAEGDPAYEFYRVYGALRLQNGNYVVSDGGSSEIRFFDEAGKLIRTVGRRGSGPGEFGEFSSLRLCEVGGRLIVEDGGLARFHVFEESGEFVKTVALTGGSGRPGILGCFGDGSLLTVRGGQTLEGAPGGVIQLQARYHRYAPDGTYANPLVALDGRLRFVNQVGGRTHYPFIPFTPEPQVAAGNDYFVATTGGQAVVTKYDLSGNPMIELHWDAGARQRVSAVWERYQRVSLAEMESPRDRQMYGRFYERDLPLPDFVPVAQSLLVDRQGNVWLERYRMPWDTNRRWVVIDPKGVHLGELAMPTDLKVLDIGSNYVLGRHLDEMNVERIQAYRLVKPIS